MAIAVTMVAGCNVEGRVDVTVHDDGSGVVTVSVGLDDEALAELGDPDKAFRTEDLAEAGWRVTPLKREGGRSWIRASKRFRSPKDLGPLMDEVGLFADWTLAVSDGFGSTSWRIGGLITARHGLEQFSDDALAATLDGMPLGMTPEELAKRLDEHGPMLVDVSVHLPGSTEDRTRFTVDVSGETAEQKVSVTSRRSSGAPLRWFLLGAVLLTGAAALATVGHITVTRRRYRRRR